MVRIACFLLLLPLLSGCWMRSDPQPVDWLIQDVRNGRAKFDTVITGYGWQLICIASPNGQMAGGWTQFHPDADPPLPVYAQGDNAVTTVTWGTNIVVNTYFDGRPGVESHRDVMDRHEDVVSLVERLWSRTSEEPATLSEASARRLVMMICLGPDRPFVQGG